MTSAATILGWITILIVAGLVHLSLVWRCAKRSSIRDDATGARSLRRILALACLVRLPFLFTDPALSDDVWRNLWDGRVQIQGINPYLYSPDDERLANLRDDIVWPRINHPEYRTIYPPLGQIAATVAAVISGVTRLPELFAWKLLVAAIEITGMWLLGRELVRRGAVSWLAIWALSPLAVFEFSGGGHIDGIALGLSGAAAAFWLRDRPLAAGTFFAGAVLTKFIPLPAAAGFIAEKGALRAGLAAIALSALLALPYLSAGSRTVESAGVYAGNWEFNGVLSRWLHIDTWGYGLTSLLATIGIVPPWSGHEKPFGRMIAWSAVLIAGAVAAARGTDSWLVARRTLAAFLAVQPTIYPWYLANLLPFLCISPSWSVAAWIAVSPLTYHAVYGRAVTGAWSENHLLQNALFSGAVLLFLLEYLTERRKHA